MAGSIPLLWIAAGLIGLATVAPQIEQAVDGGHSRAEAGGGYAIPRAGDGQFYVEGRAGDVAVRFLVDQGSDTVLLAGSDAARMGLAARPGFVPVTLPRLAVGPHELRDVQAIVAPDLPVSLLGRSFLDRLAAAEVQRDRMVLR